ncbi:MAG: tetratricopeptide repeat protein [Planctomycetes bacterium]|nr:tetratricopeptide repeat protein [Planctomycetota bacterium]
MRREVRGEKPEPEKPGGRPDETIADALLKLLAENGRHLTQLGENERVTVALTLVSGQACAQCHGPTMTGRGTEPWLLYLGNVGIGQGQSGLTVLDATGTVSTPPWAVRQPVPVVGQPAGLKDAEQKIAGFKADAHKSALLGDLRAKDGQIDQAVEAYQKALAAYSAALETQRRASLDVTGLPSPRDVAVELEIMELKTKLAQLYLAQGKTEQAQQAIQSLANSAQRTAQAEALSKAGSGQGREPLPPRLVMSVSKKLLDQVGSGQSTFEEFRKAATVQYLKFDEPGPAPTKP